MTDYPKDIARFYSTYAKGYHAGAFATPTAKEIAAVPGGTHDLTEGDHRTVYTFQHQLRGGSRRGFDGEGIPIQAGSIIVTHVARTPGAPVPEFASWCDYIQTYTEDFELAEGLREQGFRPRGVRVTAASELITVWWQGLSHKYPDYDQATVTSVDVPNPPTYDMLAEVESLDGWDDDYPLYSDGSWSALSLRGFYPEDPTRGVKPAEMDRKWKAEHEADLSRECEWTSLALDCPSIVEWVQSVSWWGSLERVRLLRMSKGKLGRHTDILDRNGGTRNGQIVRFHTPIITHPDITMSNWDLDGSKLVHHLEPWKTYYLDARKPHAVDNPTDVVRVHLVADVVCSEEVRQNLAS